jgi:hypothetical protein
MEPNYVKFKRQFTVCLSTFLAIGNYVYDSSTIFPVKWSRTQPALARPSPSPDVRIRAKLGPSTSGFFFSKKIGCNLPICNPRLHHLLNPATHTKDASMFFLAARKVVKALIVSNMQASTTF